MEESVYKLKGLVGSTVVFMIMAIIYSVFYLPWGIIGVIGLFDGLSSGFEPGSAIVVVLLLLFLIPAIVLWMLFIRGLVNPKTILVLGMQGIQVVKTNQLFPWETIQSIRYEHEIITGNQVNVSNVGPMRVRTYNKSTTNGRRHIDSLYIKPVDGRTVKVDISYIDGYIDDLASDIKKFSPQLSIQGFRD